MTTTDKRKRRAPEGTGEAPGSPRLGIVAKGAGAAVVLAALVWAYWSTIAGLIKDWGSDPNYSVGQLVPFAALYLLWCDRKSLQELKPTPCGWGVILILLAQAARFFGLVFMYESAERFALIMTVIGLTLLMFGWRVFVAVRWIMVFLFLTVPFPGRIHNMISGPLQSMSASGAVFVLELLGVTVTRQGNVMLLNDSVTVAVAEACSGLRMLTAFVVVGCVLAYIIPRARWQKATIVLSTVPVAIACNLIRLVITAQLFLAVDSETAERFFHDFAGLTMMPMAIALLLFELWILDRLVLDEPPPKASLSGR